MADMHPKYPTPWTGPEFEEGIMRILTADLEKFAWLWIDTDEGPCDLDIVKEPGCYVVLEHEHGIPDYDMIAPFSFMVEHQNDVLYQIAFIGPDCWYRYYIEETDTWTEWKIQIEHPIFKSKNAPENPYDSQIWLRIPDGDWYEYILYRYSEVTKKWEPIWGDDYLTHVIYDPQHYYMDMYQYFNLSLKEQMGVLTKHDCDIIQTLYKSEFYSAVSHMMQVDNHYYFLINPEAIYAGDDEITADQFWILDYTADEHNVVELTEVIGSKINGNVRQFIHMKDGYFFVRLSNGEVYYSTDLHLWINAVNSVSTHEYLSQFTHEELEEYTHDEISVLAEMIENFPSIDYIEKLDDDRLYFFGNDGSIYFRTLENSLLLYGDKILPSDFLVYNAVAWKNGIFIAGHMRNGDVCPVYYYSLDEGRTVRPYTLPVARRWTKLYFTEDFLLISTDDAGTEFEKNTYYTIDPNLTEDNVRVAANDILAKEYRKFENVGNRHDIHELTWLPYKKELGGGAVSDTGGILIEFVLAEKLPMVEYVESRYEQRIRTTYNFLTRYYHDDLVVYTYEEIKYIASHIVSAMERIEFGEYEEGGVVVKSFGSMSDDTYGFIFKGENETFGFQTVRFETFYETFKWHINDWTRHLTAEEREFVFKRVTRPEADAILKNHRDTLQAVVDEKKGEFELEEDLNNVADVAEKYVTHIQNDSIHVTPEQVSKWNNKEDGDHTHFLDNRVQLSIDDFVQGTFSPDRFPKEAFSKMITVKSIPEMLTLSRNDIRNGYTVRVYDPETMDLKFMPCGRLFRVMNDRQLNLLSSYLEYTMDLKNSYLYYFAITEKPTDRDGFGIEDVYLKTDTDELIAYGSKLNYGFDTMNAGDIKHTMEGYNKILASKDFIEKNTSNMSKDLIPLNQAFRDNVAGVNYDVIKERDIFQYLDFQPWFKVPLEIYSRDIYDIFYIEELKIYYVATMDDFHIGIYKTDFTKPLVGVYEESKIDRMDFMQNCQVVYAMKTHLLFAINGKFVLHELATGNNTTVFDPYIKGCYYIEHGDDDYAIHIIYVDTSKHLHFSSITTKAELEDMKFDHVISEPDQDICSLVYSNGTILITMYNSAVTTMWMYCHMSRFLRSREWFDDVNIYLGTENPIPFALLGYADLPSIVKKTSDTRIIYQYQDPHCINLRKDQGYSYTATYLTLEKNNTNHYFLRSRMLYYNESGTLENSVRDINEIVPTVDTDIYWNPDGLDTSYVPIDEQTFGILSYGIYTGNSVRACQLLLVNVKDNSIEKLDITIGYREINAIHRCADGFIYFLGSDNLIAKYSINELIEHGRNPELPWNGNIVYTSNNVTFTKSDFDGETDYPIHIGSALVNPCYRKILESETSISDHYYIAASDLCTKYDNTTKGDQYIIKETGDKKLVEIFYNGGDSGYAESTGDGYTDYIDISTVYSGGLRYFVTLAMNASGSPVLTVKYKTETEALTNIADAILTGFTNSRLTIVPAGLNTILIHVMGDEKINRYHCTRTGIKLVESRDLKSVNLTRKWITKLDVVPNTQFNVIHFGVYPYGNSAVLNTVQWVRSNNLRSSKILKMYDVYITKTECLGIALGDKSEIIMVSFTYNTTTSEYKIHDYGSKQLSGLGQLDDMYVMNVPKSKEAVPDKDEGYDTIIFLKNKYGEIFVSPLWTDTWSELYTRDRFLLGTHNDSIYQSIEDSIRTIEESL